MEQEEQADHHGGIADTGHDESLLSRAAIHGVPIPEPDEQVTAQPDALPAEIQQEQIVRQQQCDHRRHEQVHVGEEAAVPLIAAHEFGGIEVDQEGDERDHEHHHERERIQVEGDSGAEGADGNPRPQVLRIDTGRVQKRGGDQHGDGG